MGLLDGLNDEATVESMATDVGARDRVQRNVINKMQCESLLLVHHVMIGARKLSWQDFPKMCRDLISGGSDCKLVFHDFNICMGLSASAFEQ